VTVHFNECSRPRWPTDSPHSHFGAFSVADPIVSFEIKKVMRDKRDQLDL
jgi:hypothetical protein